MIHDTILAPFSPDEDIPYCFISYAHKDRDLVFPIIKQLYENGWGMWYDEGLEIGSEYYTSLENHIKGCTLFLLFATQNAANSEFIVNREIPKATEFCKEKIVIHMDTAEPVDIPGLDDGIHTEVAQIESILKKYPELPQMSPRQAVGHNVRQSILRQTRDNLFRWEKTHKGVSLNGLVGEHPVVLLPGTYPPFTDLEVTEVSPSVFMHHPEVCEVYIQPELKQTDILTFFMATGLKALHVPAGVSLTNLHKLEMDRIPYTIYCAKGSQAHKFAQEQGIMHQIEDTPDNTVQKNIKPYAYLSFTHWCQINTVIAIEALQDAKCSYIFQRKKLSKKKIREQITDCACFVAFIDQHYLESSELNNLRLAMLLQKKVAIYQLEEIELPEDLQRLQDIHQIRFDRGDPWERATKLVNWLTKQGCRNPYEYFPFSYTVAKEGLQLSDYRGKYPNVHIKAFYDGIPVHSVWSLWNPDILSVTLEDGIKKIGFHAFFGCSKLRSVTLPHSITSIDMHAFEGCTALRSIEIPPKVTYIGSKAFKDCKNLKKLQLPDGISVAQGVYAGWPNLTRIRIPENDHIISSGAFEGCSNLKTVLLHDNVTSIDQYAFKDCTSLQKITLPANLTSIGARAFENCTSLQELVLPASLQRVGLNAISGCTALKKLVVTGMETRIWVGKDILQSLHIYCVEGSKMQERCEKNNLSYTLWDPQNHRPCKKE